MQKEHISRVLLIYLLITFGLAVFLSVLAGFTGGHTSKFNNLGLLTMFMPAIAVAILSVSKKSLPYIDWKIFPIKWLPIALLIFPFIIHVACLPVVACQNNFNIPWQPWLYPQADGLFHTPVEKNWGVLTKSGLVAHILLNLAAGLIAVSVFAFFEEIGWRAWMLPRLIERFNLKTGIFITAIIGALWHLLFIISGIQHINNAPLATVILFYPLGHIGVGIILCWLFIKSQSIWIVSLAHGSLNDWGQYAFKYMNDASSTNETIALVAALNLSLLLVGLIVFFSLKENSKKL